MTAPGFPPEIQPAFELLRTDMVDLAWKLVLFRNGFVNRANRTVLFERTATVFAIIEDSLTVDIIISIARLMDPPVQGGNKNLTLRYLFELVRDHGKAPNLLDRIEGRYQSLKPVLEPIYLLRRKVLAHRDRPIALTTPLSLPITDQNIVMVCEEFQGIINDIDRHFADSGTAFDVQFSVSNLDALLILLRRGMKGMDDDRAAETEKWRPKPGS